MSIFAVEKTGPGRYVVCERRVIAWTGELADAERIASVLTAYSENKSEQRNLASADLLKAWGGTI